MMFVAKGAAYRMCEGHTVGFFERSHLRERCDEEGYLGQRCGLHS